jgi:hypothetical protein
VVGDPAALKAVLRAFLNDHLGGFHSNEVRLPTRFFMNGLHELYPEELDMIKARLVEFLNYWLSIATNPACPPDSPALPLMNWPYDGLAIMTFMLRPPTGFIPRSEFFFKLSHLASY